MEKLVHKRRLLVFAVLIIMAMAGLGVRLVILQYVEHEKDRLLAQKIRKRTFLRQPRRGTSWTGTAICWRVRCR